MEKVVAKRYQENVDEHKLEANSQSSYRKFHSTETALLKIQSDIIHELDNGNPAALVLLDLSAAIDTIDQSRLLGRLNCLYGISGTTLEWFESYLVGRQQVVIIAGQCAVPKPLSYGVPQGSVLGPKTYCAYTKPPGVI